MEKPTRKPRWGGTDPRRGGHPADSAAKPTRLCSSSAMEPGSELPMLKAQGTEGGQTHRRGKLRIISTFSPRCVPRKRPKPLSCLCGFREDFGGGLAQHPSGPITAITELSLRGQPSIKTGPKIPTEDAIPQKSGNLVKKTVQGGQGMVPNTCSPSPCCCRRVFPKVKLSHPRSGSFPRAGSSEPRVYLPRSGGTRC